MTDKLPPCAYLQSISLLKQVQFTLGNMGLGMSSIRSIVLYVQDIAHGQDFFMALQDMAPMMSLEVTLVPVAQDTDARCLVSCDVVAEDSMENVSGPRFTKREPSLPVGWWKWA